MIDSNGKELPEVALMYGKIILIISLLIIKFIFFIIVILRI